MPRGHCPASILEFFFVHIDGNIGVEEVLKSTGVIHVKMADDHSSDICDIVPCCLDCFGKSMADIIRRSWEHVGCRRSPFLSSMEECQPIVLEPIV